MRSNGIRKKTWARFEAIHPCVGMLSDWQLLCAWVIVQALVDIAEPEVIVTPKSAEQTVWKAVRREHNRREAIRWIKSGDEWMKSLCAICLVDRREIRELMQQILEENDARNNPTN